MKFQIFAEIQNFCRSSRFLLKSQNFYQNSKFYSKFLIFTEIRNFHRNSKFLLKFKMFAAVENFHPNSKCSSNCKTPRRDNTERQHLQRKCHGVQPWKKPKGKQTFEVRRRLGRLQWSGILHVRYETLP